MSQRANWSRLGIGLAATASVIGVALLILVFGRVGTIHGRKFTLYITTDAARGVNRGTDVWLDGQRVGSVEDVDFRQVTVGKSERVVLSLQILERIRDHIRTDSHIQIRSGGSIIGEQVVALQSGTLKQPIVRNGDTLHARPQKDVEGATSEAGLAAREFRGVMANVKLLSAQLQTAEGTIGALRLEGSGRGLSDARRRAERLKHLLSESDGTLSLFRAGAGDLRARARQALSQADSVRALVASEKNSLGRFRRDSSIVREIKLVRDELREVARLAADTSGSVGRTRNDSAIVLGLQRTATALDSLMRDLRKRPLRYIAF